jgi:hypothetical protein
VEREEVASVRPCMLDVKGLAHVSRGMADQVTRTCGVGVSKKMFFVFLLSSFFLTSQEWTTARKLVKEYI